MSEHLPVIVVLAPLFGAVIVGFFGSRDRRLCFPIALTALALSFICSIGVVHHVATVGAWDYFVGGWESPHGVGIQLRADGVNSLLLLAIAVVALLALVYSIRQDGEKDAEKSPFFYVLFLLLCVGLFGITITGDAFNVYVLIEITALTSYGLVAMGSSRRSRVAAFQYLVIGTVGASFYLIGVGYLYLAVGSLNMADIRAILAANPEIANSRIVGTALVFILLGVWTKMSLFPLHGWLPNAYSYCPSGSANLMAPLVTKVSVYVMIRILFSVFGLGVITENPGWSELVVLIAVGSIVAGSVMALTQREIKKMLCCLIVAEVGYMVGGTWLGDAGRWGLTGSMYHILADAMMTSCLFLAAGVFAKQFGATRLEHLSGLFRRSPWVAGAFTLGGLAMIGVPPMCGFFSKFYLIRGAIESGHWLYIVALLGSSLVNAILFFRIFEIAYFGEVPESSEPFEPSEGEGATPRRYAVWRTAPLLIAAALTLLLGIFNRPVIDLIRGTVVENTGIVSMEE